MRNNKTTSSSFQLHLYTGHRMDFKKYRQVANITLALTRIIRKAIDINIICSIGTVRTIIVKFKLHSFYLVRKIKFQSYIVDWIEKKFWSDRNKSVKNLYGKTFSLVIYQFSYKIERSHVLKLGYVLK